MKDSVKVLICGDFCSKASTDLITVSDELKNLIQSSDISVINFEVPLKPDSADCTYHDRELFYQNDDAPDFLCNLGFDLFTLANNHTFDFGDEGYFKTKNALGDSAFGVGNYEDAYKAKIVEVKGIRIGFLGCSFAAYKGVFSDVLNHEGFGCPYINDLKFNHAIIDAKKQVDFLFILPHDGIEYIDVPLPETVARYRDFIDYGADAVIASHPHCPQGWEDYKGKPIFYSLGNFLFNSKDGYDYRANNRPHWYEGLCVVCTIVGDNITWDVFNTRNIGNKGLEIDWSEERVSHNDIICRYLSDKKEYLNYFSKICEGMGFKNEMSIIDRTVHSHSFMSTIKSLVKNRIGLLQGKKETSDDYSLQRLLSHDARRNLLLHSIKFHYKRN